MKKILYTVLALMPAAHASPGFTFSNPAGHFEAGFRVVQQYDRTRAFKGAIDEVTGRAVTGEKARPMQTLVWYPATGGGAALHYLDYLKTSRTELNFPTAPETAADAEKIRLAVIADIADDIGVHQAQQELAQTMRAKRDATPADGKFPVVVYAPGSGGTAAENADLCEYLASHGYVVIASTSLAVKNKRMTFDNAGLQQQIRDIEFLIGYAHTLPQADTANIAAMGWSWGGLANVFAASRDARIGAIVSLDGSKEPALMKTLAPESVTAPWLYISRSLRSVPELNRNHIDTSFSFLNAARFADVYQLTLNPMLHGHMVSVGIRTLPETDFAEYSQEEVAQAYSWMALYILNFLNAELKHEPAAASFMQNTPRKNGAPPHMATLEFSAAQQPAPTRATFAAALRKQGFEHAVALYQATEKKHPSFQLSEDELLDWADALQKTDGKEALAIYRLATVNFPDSATSFESLGKAYAALHDNANASASFRRASQLDPGNANKAVRVQASGNP